MRKLSRTSLIGWVILISATGIALELLLNWRLLIPLLVGCFLVYKGKWRREGSSRNIYLIIGFSLLIMAIISSAFFKLIIIIGVIYGLIHYSKSKKSAKRIVVETTPPDSKSRYTKKQPYFKNMFTGSQKVTNQVYEWDDINIQCGIGNTSIDLGMTMLPPGESVVIIRGLIGNVELLVPFDAAVSVNHSTLSGKLKVFNHSEEMFHSNIIYYPDHVEGATRSIKVITSVLVGNVEVRRI